MVAGPRKELLAYSERGKRRDAVPKDFSPNLELFNPHERRCLEDINRRMKGLREEEEVIKDLLEAGLIREDFKAIQDNLALSESVLRRYVFVKFPSEIVKLRVPSAALEALNQGKRIVEHDNTAAPRSSHFQPSASGAPVLPPQPRVTAAAAALVPQAHYNHQHHRPAPHKKPVTMMPASACGPGDIDREEARPQAAFARALGSDDSSDELFVSRTRRVRSTTATSGDTAVTSDTVEQQKLDEEEEEEEEQQQKKKPAKNPRKRLKQMADTRPKRRKLNPEDRPYDPEREEQKRRNSLIFD